MKRRAKLVKTSVLCGCLPFRFFFSFLVKRQGIPLQWSVWSALACGHHYFNPFVERTIEGAIFGFLFISSNCFEMELVWLEEISMDGLGYWSISLDYKCL